MWFRHCFAVKLHSVAIFPGKKCIVGGPCGPRVHVQCTQRVNQVPQQRNSLGKCGAQHKAHSQLLCMNYNARAVYNISALTDSQCRCSVQCMCTKHYTNHVNCTCTERFGLHMRCKLFMHSTAFTLSAQVRALIVYNSSIFYTAPVVCSVSALTEALCTYVVHCEWFQRATGQARCKCTQRCPVHVPRALSIQAPMNCKRAVGTVSSGIGALTVSTTNAQCTLNSAQCTCIVCCTFTHRCTVHVQCTMLACSTVYIIIVLSGVLFKCMGQNSQGTLQVHPPGH